MASGEVFSGIPAAGLRKRDVRTFDSAGVDVSEREGRGTPPTHVATVETGFVPNDFQYNGRFVLVFAPCLFIMVAFGGKVALGTIILGSMTAYIMDMSGQREGTFIAFWVTLISLIVGIVVNGFFLLRASWWNALLIYNMSIVIVLMGTWGSLNFKWLHWQASHIVPVMERVLFTAVMFPTAVVLTWAVTGISGFRNAPFYLCIILFVLYVLFGLPRTSSFRQERSTIHRGGEVKRGDFITGSVEAAAQTLSVVLLPTIFYVALHHAVLFSTWENITNLLAVICLPIVLLRMVSSKGAFWWTGLSSEALSRTEVVMTVLSTYTLLGCFEYRVVFLSFNSLVTLLPPWNYIVVTLALYSVHTILILHFSGRLGSQSRFALGSLAVLGAVAVSLSLGVPWYLWGCPVVAAYYLASFYFDRKFSQYFLFVSTTLLFLVWFVNKTFWFLEFDFAILGLSLHEVSMIFTFLFALALLIPGITIVNMSPTLTGTLLLIHAVGLCFVELLLFSQFVEIYSPFLVMFTSGVGVYLAIRLERERRITRRLSLLLLSVYIGKLSILLSPEALLPSLLLVLTVAPVFFAGQGEGPQKPRMAPILGIFHVVSIGVATLYARHGVVYPLLLMLTGQAPSISVTIASCLLVWSVACLPLSYQHFKHIALFKRLNTLLLATAIFIAFIQPEMDGDSVTSSMSQSLGPVQAQWLLLLSLVLAVSSMTSIFPLPTSIVTRTLYSLSLGLSLGFYFTTTYLPESMVLSVLFALMFVLLVTFVVFTHWPSADSDRTVIFVYALLLTLLPVTYIVEGYVFKLSRKRDMLALSRLALVAVYAVFNIIIALFVKIKLEGKRPTIKDSGASWRRSASLDFDWLPKVGNIATLMGFTLSVVLNIRFLGGSETCIFFLAPLLLFLNQDVYLLKNLSDRNRYAPILLVTSVFLTGSAAYNLVLRMALERLHLMPVTSAFDYIFTLKNIALAVATLPSHIFFNKYLWSFKQQNNTLLTCFLPLNILPIVFADLSTLQMLGAVGLVGVVIQLYVSSQIRSFGRRLL